MGSMRALLDSSEPALWVAIRIFIAIAILYGVIWWFGPPPSFVIDLWTYIIWLAIPTALLQVWCFFRVPRKAIGRDLCSFFMLYIISLFLFSTWYYKLPTEFGILSPSEVEQKKSRVNQIEGLKAEDWFQRAKADDLKLLELWKAILLPANVAVTGGPPRCPLAEVLGAPYQKALDEIDCLNIERRNRLIEEEVQLKAHIERASFLNILFYASGNVHDLLPKTTRGKLLVIGQRVWLFFLITVYLTALARRPPS